MDQIPVESKFTVKVAGKWEWRSLLNSTMLDNRPPTHTTARINMRSTVAGEIQPFL